MTESSSLSIYGRRLQKTAIEVCVETNKTYLTNFTHCHLVLLNALFENADMNELYTGLSEDIKLFLEKRQVVQKNLLCIWMNTRIINSMNRELAKDSFENSTIVHRSSLLGLKGENTKLNAYKFTKCNAENSVITLHDAIKNDIAIFENLYLRINQLLSIVQSNFVHQTSILGKTQNNNGFEPNTSKLADCVYMKQLLTQLQQDIHKIVFAFKKRFVNSAGANSSTAEAVTLSVNMNSSSCSKRSKRAANAVSITIEEES